MTIPTTRTRVLISGASIAGPALAYWLDRYGFETTIVERAPELRTGGQNVDVRGAGREVVRRMGLEDDVRAATTGEVGTRFVGPTGGTVAEFPAGTSDSGGATAELEILRGDLARLLVGRTTGDGQGRGTTYRFGDRITGIREDDGGGAAGAAADAATGGDPMTTVASTPAGNAPPGSVSQGVVVSFEHAPDERFDLVVAADGIGSSTRRLVFGDEPTIRSLGLETSYATIPRTADDDDWWRWYNAAGGRSITLRPDAHGTIRAAMSFVTDRTRERGGAERRTVAEQRARLHEIFDDAGWEARRVLAGFDQADDLYFESIGQVRAPRWSTGRVVLLGDAAYCASPVSGMGTSLSLAGAYVLAGELASHRHHRDAIAGYERLMRPYVEQAQQLPPGVPRVANPTSRAGVALFHAGVRLASTRVARRLGARFSTPPADALELPDYAHLEP
ncbi:MULTISPECIES: FAD-dependent monooxygenase [unclassified Frigoribacterium]|uniref:FAD-dependent monooxygenase n=1 Tax=unclassified Frigoribacterium TaxID=2627005 RepID=UPI000ADF38E8|nr:MULTISPECIES: FAD-dependent monooxygenase [unclassified Frigoribacterium]